MAAVNEHNPDLLYADDDPLVRRLRTLQWAQAPDEVRQRCWEEFSRRITQMTSSEQEAQDQGAQQPSAHVEERYPFSRRVTEGRLAVAQAWRRPAHATALYA
jgi:hypothetical protein